MTTFFEALARRSAELDSLVCVGLDPDFGRHAVAGVSGYLRGIIEETLPYAACYKPNIAFFEQWGVAGLRQLEATLRAIPDGVPIIGDVKRGDMGNTSEAYARAMFREWGFDAVTLAGYQGLDSVSPFLAYEGKGVYVLCRTSNPSSAEFQALELANGRRLFEEVAVVASAWSPSVGLVVGATAPEELRRVRELVPETPLLIPGVGAQGGTAQDVVAAAGYVPGKMVVNSSRAILYAGGGTGQRGAAGVAAQELRDQLRAARA